MYFTFLIPAVLLIVLLLLFFCHRKKKKLIDKICRLSMHDKCCFLNELTEPFGYKYDVRQDIFTSTVDAWQKFYGYGNIYDRLAPHASMIFDCQPIYFDFEGKTWLIEFWKGQYGINTGSEIGIYRASGIVPPEQRKTTMFAAVPEEEYLDMRTELLCKGEPIAAFSAVHWWLTMFCMGRFSHPKELTLNVSIRFTDMNMRDAFVDALFDNGYDPESVCVCFGTVIFTVQIPHKHRCFLRRLYRCYVQWKNHMFCRLFHFITRPFSNTCDKILYLYFYVSFAFRHMLRLKRFRKRPHHHPENKPYNLK